MKKIFLTTLIALLSLPLFSQNSNAIYQIGVRQIDLERNNEFLNLTDAEYKQVIGSPYAIKEFMQGNIYQGDKLVQSGIFLRYNMYADEIEIKNSIDDTEYNALVKDSNVFVKIFNDVYVLIPFEGSDEKGSYFKIITPGKHLDLYKKSSVVYTPRTFPKTSYDREKPAKFTQTDTYFLVEKTGKFVELPNSKSKLLKVMKNKGKEVKSFLKKNNINLKKEKDLIKLVKYYNTLL